LRNPASGFFPPIASAVAIQIDVSDGKPGSTAEAMEQQITTMVVRKTVMTST